MLFGISCNVILWAEEDLARRQDVPETDIVNNKRNIDRYNQERNDYIEKIDEAIISKIPNTHKFKENVRVNSETAGSIIDRLSINSLRNVNMRKQMKRPGACPSIKDKLSIAQSTRNAFGSLLGQIIQGNRGRMRHIQSI